MQTKIECRSRGKNRFSGGFVRFHSNCWSIRICVTFQFVVTGWQIRHLPLKSSWRWLGGTGLTLSRSSHSSNSTAEDSFGGSLYIFEEPALFWLEGWRAFMRFHRGDEEAPTQEAPVLARFRSFLVRYYGEDWEAMILSESGEVLLFELRAILAGWLGLVEEQREGFAQAMDSWPQIVFRARVKSLAEAGGFLCLD